MLSIALVRWHVRNAQQPCPHVCFMRVNVIPCRLVTGCDQGDRLPAVIQGSLLPAFHVQRGA